jgi:hypothetical protein
MQLAPLHRVASNALWALAFHVARVKQLRTFAARAAEDAWGGGGGGGLEAWMRTALRGWSAAARTGEVRTARAAAAATAAAAAAAAAAVAAKAARVLPVALVAWWGCKS